MARSSLDRRWSLAAAVPQCAEMVSYEVSLGFIIISVLLLVGSMNLTDIVESQNRGLGLLNWHVLPLFPLFVMFFVSALAETNRPPFDLPEAESELVAGYQVEYSSTPYLLFMIGEYMNIVLMCSMTVILFLGGWLSPVGDLFGLNAVWLGPAWFAVKVVFIFFLFAMVKAIVPRYRYDQLMRIGWKIFLPTSIVYLTLVAGLLIAFPGLAEMFHSWRS
ncbi:MAG: NADH-quinone oxidoreductase subunit H [Pseudomonadota bacterium]